MLLKKGWKNKLLLLTLTLIFIIKDLRSCSNYRIISTKTNTAAIGTITATNTHKNAGNYTINNKNKSNRIIGIRNSNSSNNSGNNSHNDDNSSSNCSKNDGKSNNKNIKISNKYNYTSGTNAEFLEDDPSERLLKYTRFLWANTAVQCVQRTTADINEEVIFNIKSTNRISLLALCQDWRSWKHDSRSDWLQYRSVRNRDCTGFKMFAEDNCIFYINFGERKQNYFDKNGNCAYCASSPQHIDCNVTSTLILSRTQKLIYIMGNIHVKQRTTAYKQVYITLPSLSY